MSDLIGTWGRAAVAGIIATIASGAGYAVLYIADRDAHVDELLPLLTGPMALVAVGLVGFVLNWISRVPFGQWESLDKRVAELEGYVRPKISVLTATNHRAESIDYGTTTETTGGTRQIVIGHGPNHSLRLDITNDSLQTLRGLEAYLTRFEDMDENEEPKAWFSSRLPWMEAGQDQSAVTNIPSGGLRSVVLFRVINNRVHLVRTDGMPAHMAGAIKEKGEYRGLVTISAENCASAYIAFQLYCDGPDSAPLLNVVRQSMFDRDDDTPWVKEAPFVC